MIHDMDTMKSRRQHILQEELARLNPIPRSISAPPNCDDDAHFFLCSRQPKALHEYIKSHQSRCWISNATWSRKIYIGVHRSQVEYILHG